ncbi:unnamed protein product [Ectocarpus sp. CCAP 1310/34]|nr:unnamed protein product [Ectocarpus sp. CCAP 1310/34]
MAWRCISIPVVAATLLGAVIALTLLSKPAPPRQTKAEKRNSRRQGRKRGRAATSKRTRSKRKQNAEMLINEIGIDEFKKMVLKGKLEKEEQQERMRRAMDDPDSLRLVIDLNWAESAPGKELSSLVKQLCYVYSRAKASSMPPRLTLTSYQGKVAAALESAGADSWLVDRNPLGVFTVFDPTEIIYLSPDAEEPLDQVLDTNVYVVGGIVDRNLRKGLTLGAADGARARAARLPFDEYLPEIPRGDRVLTVCACVGVLMGVRAGEGWRDALQKSVPRRGVEKAARRARGRAWRGTVAEAVGAGQSGWGVVGNFSAGLESKAEGGVDVAEVKAGAGSSSVKRSEGQIPPHAA